MSACTIRYRLDGAGPAMYVVDIDGAHYFYSRGELGTKISPDRLPVLLASTYPRWVPASGDVMPWNDPRGIEPSADPSLFGTQVNSGAELTPM